MKKPTIAMLQGDAVGGGLFMAISCDLRLAASTSASGCRWRGRSATSRAGELPLLAATIGMIRARDLVLTARLVGAPRHGRRPRRRGAAGRRA